MSADYESNPWPMLNEIRENHPITFHEGLNSWLLSRFEDVEKVLTSRTFTTENYAGSLSQSTAPPFFSWRGPSSLNQGNHYAHAQRALNEGHL